MPGKFAAFLIWAVFIVNISDKIMVNLSQGDDTMGNLKSLTTL